MALPVHMSHSAVVLFPISGCPSSCPPRFAARFVVAVVSVIGFSPATSLVPLCLRRCCPFAFAPVFSVVACFVRLRCCPCHRPFSVTDPPPPPPRSHICVPSTCRASCVAVFDVVAPCAGLQEEPCSKFCSAANSDSFLHQVVCATSTSASIVRGPSPRRCPGFSAGLFVSVLFSDVFGNCLRISPGASIICCAAFCLWAHPQELSSFHGRSSCIDVVFRMFVVMRQAPTAACLTALMRGPSFEVHESLVPYLAHPLRSMGPSPARGGRYSTLRALGLVFFLPPRFLPPPVGGASVMAESRP